MSRPEISARHQDNRVGLLFKAYLRGDRRCLDELVSELTPLLWQVARSQDLSRSASEDVVQTTWLTLLREKDRIHTPSALVGWLITTTKREAWRVRSAERREPSVDDATVFERPDVAVSPDDHVLVDDCRRRLWLTVGRLSQRCQDLLRVVAFVPRPDYDVVGAALDMSRDAVGPTRSRCLAKLRALLDADRWEYQP